MTYSVLVPLDGSPEAGAILSHLEPLGSSGALRVVLFEATAQPQDEPAARANLQKAADPLQARGIDTQCLTGVGPPAELILELAARERADLIAMTTHGRTGLTRLLMGSVTETVLRHSTLPLLVARPGTPSRPWRRIVLALDGSENSERVLPFTLALAHRVGASIDLVMASLPVDAHPLHPDGFPASYYPEGDPLPYLNAIRERIAVEHVPAETHSLTEFPARGIVEHAHSNEAGLICICTHGRGGLNRLLLGSVAEGVLRHTPCPVFVIRGVAR